MRSNNPVSDFPLSTIPEAARTYATGLANTPFEARLAFARQHSRYLDQRLIAQPELTAWLALHAGHLLSESAMRAYLAAQLPATAAYDEALLRKTLRGLRQRVMSLLILRDVAEGASLAEVVETMTLLADVTTQLALDQIYKDLVQRYGTPVGAAGTQLQLAIIGMGKLGGRELNVSSDVDYIFVYPEEGETLGRADGTGKIDNFDFFSRLGKRLVACLDDLTEDGRVFRVDMRLRPNGDSGPLVCSSDMLEKYVVTQGREWERYAWIKARIMNDDDQHCMPELIQMIARPFVYRKYLDFGAINAMRALHAQIRQEVTRKDRMEHIKLGPGGIREIEFIAQVFQLIRGGRESSLQLRPTLLVLNALETQGLLTREDVAELTEAYVFLRRLEHRLQYLDDAQTHMLPDTEADQQRLAESMGFSQWNTLYTQLNQHRQRVSQHFQAIFADPNAANQDQSSVQAIWLGTEGNGNDNAITTLRTLGYTQPEEILDRIKRLTQGSRYQQLPATNRERLDAAACSLIPLAGCTRFPHVALLRGLDFLESIAGRGAYLALLQQYPRALHKLADLMSTSSWAAQFLTRHPLLLDELLDQRLLETATDFDAYRVELDRTLANAHDDTEMEMNILREMHHAQVFRLLVQDLAGLQSLERISDFLSELADIIVDRTLKLVWQKLNKRHTDTPHFAVIGYGKLGGKELGYGSDLDVVYLYDDPDSDAAQTYLRLSQRLSAWLSSQTSSGIVYDIDTRLRPNGESGMLAISLSGFQDYEQHAAWTWEHQALTRARFVAGDPVLGARFEAIRRTIIGQSRDLIKLRQDVRTMREKMLASHAPSPTGFFDLKQDPGGIIDVEFIVQFLVLAHSHQHPDLADNVGNIALLHRFASHGLIDPARAQSVQNAYRAYRQQQHINRLNDDPKARLPINAALQTHINAVLGLKELVL